MTHAGLPFVTQAVSKLFFGDRDEILSREFGLRRNNVSPTLPSGFNCCAEGLGVGVFTQPGPKADIHWIMQFCRDVSSGGLFFVRFHIFRNRDPRLFAAGPDMHVRL